MTERRAGDIIEHPEYGRGVLFESDFWSSGLGVRFDNYDYGPDPNNSHSGHVYRSKVVSLEKKGFAKWINSKGL